MTRLWVKEEEAFVYSLKKHGQGIILTRGMLKKERHEWRLEERERENSMRIWTQTGLINFVINSLKEERQRRESSNKQDKGNERRRVNEILSAEQGVKWEAPP